METTYQREHTITLNSKASFDILNQTRYHRRYKFDDTYKTLAGLARSKTSIIDHYTPKSNKTISKSASVTKRYSAAEVVLEKEQPESIQKEESKNILTINHDIVQEKYSPRVATPNIISVNIDQKESENVEKKVEIEIEKNAEFSTHKHYTKVEYHNQVTQAQNKAMQEPHHQHHCREMCYLCSQRAERNVPVYTRLQEEKAERETAKILVSAQQRVAEKSILEDEKLRMTKREITKDFASFNLAAAKATKEKRKDEDVYKLPHESYLLRERPITPHKTVGYKKVEAELKDQIHNITKSKAKQDTDKRLIERLYQIQLAEGLNRERELYLAQKRANAKKINETIQFQISNREPELPKSYNDHEIFGKNDINADKVKNIRERNRLYSSDQFLMYKRNQSAQTQREKDRKLSEELMLKRTKTDLDADTFKRANQKLHVRKSLQSNWLKTHNAKLEREKIEKIGIPEKITVQEQLDQYRRCVQCKKKPQNRGQTNIWKESYYIPGSRIMAQ